MKGCVVDLTPLSLYPPERDSVPIIQGGPQGLSGFELPINVLIIPSRLFDILYLLLVLIVFYLELNLTLDLPNLTSNTSSSYLFDIQRTVHRDIFL